MQKRVLRFCTDVLGRLMVFNTLRAVAGTYVEYVCLFLWDALATVLLLLFYFSGAFVSITNRWRILFLKFVAYLNGILTASGMGMFSLSFGRQILLLFGAPFSLIIFFWRFYCFETSLLASIYREAWNLLLLAVLVIC